MKRALVLLALLACVLAPEARSQGVGPTIVHWGLGSSSSGGGVVTVSTKAGLEAAAADTVIDNKVIVNTDEISSGTYTGTVALPATATGGTTTTINDADSGYEFTTLCNGSCDGRIVCIVDGGTPVASPEGECREITSSGTQTFDVTVAFSSAIVAGTYYVIPDTIKLAPYLTGADKDTLRVTCGDGGTFSAGGPGAGMILEVSGENMVVDPAAEFNFDFYFDLSHCSIGGSGDADGYDVGVMFTHIPTGGNLHAALNNVTTHGMNIRNATPQGIRTGGSSVLLEQSSNVGGVHLSAKGSVFDSQNSLWLLSPTSGSSFVTSQIIDGDQSDTNAARDVGAYFNGGEHFWNGVTAELVSGFVFGNSSALTWVGGELLFPRSGLGTVDKAIVGAADGATNSTATATAGGAATLTDTAQTMVADEHAGRWVVLRPGDADEEWRRILSNTADPGDTLTVANNWTSQPVATDYYKIYEPWDRAIFVLDGTTTLNLSNIIIKGSLMNLQDPIIANPLIFLSSTTAATLNTVEILGSVMNVGCEITGAPGGGTGGTHTLIVASNGTDNVAPITGIDLTVTNSQDVAQADSTCNPITPFGPDVDFDASSKGYVRADGKEWKLNGTVWSDVSPDCVSAYTASATIDNEDLGGCLITVDTSAGDVTLTLPAAVAGMHTRIAVVNATNDLYIDCDNADSILEMTDNSTGTCDRIRTGATGGPNLGSVWLKAADGASWIGQPGDPLNWADAN